MVSPDENNSVKRLERESVERGFETYVSILASDDTQEWSDILKNLDANRMVELLTKNLASTLLGSVRAHKTI